MLGIILIVADAVLYMYFFFVYDKLTTLGLSFSNLCRIIRAFLVEEQKIVKKVLKIQKAKERQAAKS